MCVVTVTGWGHGNTVHNFTIPSVYTSISVCVCVCVLRVCECACAHVQMCQHACDNSDRVGTCKYHMRDRERERQRET